MTTAIKKLAKCEVQAVFTAKHYAAASTHREICTVYGPQKSSMGYEHKSCTRLG